MEILKQITSELYFSYITSLQIAIVNSAKVSIYIVELMMSLCNDCTFDFNMKQYDFKNGQSLTTAPNACLPTKQDIKKICNSVSIMTTMMG